MFIPPNDPPPGTPSVVQRLRLTAPISVSASTGSTYTVANLLGAVTPTLPSTYNVKFQRLMVYFPSTNATSTESPFVIVDLLPNNDSLTITDSGIIGQSRPAIGWVPTSLDRMQTFFTSSTQPVFVWTGPSTTGNIYVVMDVDARVL